VLKSFHAQYYWNSSWRDDQVHGKSFHAGAMVTELDPEGGKTFELSSEEETKLLAAIAEVDRGETTNAADVLAQIRRF
jgi:hypothetical protein